MTEPGSQSEHRSGAVHRPVLLREVLIALQLQQGLCVVDGTVGAGGHSQKILQQIGSTGTLIGMDRDPMMLKLADESLKQISTNYELVHSSYSKLTQVLQAKSIDNVDRILLDLGLSSDQLSDGHRGFSFHSEGILDLRYDVSSGIPAWEILQQYNQQNLSQIFQELGEERFANAIAEKIIQARKHTTLKTAAQLSEVVQHALPGSLLKNSRKHPATRIFQALRIQVNEEFKHLSHMLDIVLPKVIKPGGRAVVISFHSLEDRLVKQAFRDDSIWKRIDKKPVSASATEQRVNPRARTAKLRAVERK